MAAKRTLGTEELARDVEGFAADNDNLLSVEKLFGHGRGQAAQEVTLSVNNNLGKNAQYVYSMCHWRYRA